LKPLKRIKLILAVMVTLKNIMKDQSIGEKTLSPREIFLKWLVTSHAVVLERK
jgi:uncharacterized protein YjcR